MGDSILKEPLKNDIKKLKTGRFLVMRNKYNGFFRGKSKGCIAIFVERKTRFYVAVKTDDRTKNSMFLDISSLYNTLTM